MNEGFHPVQVDLYEAGIRLKAAGLRLRTLIGLPSGLNTKRVARCFLPPRLLARSRGFSCRWRRLGDIAALRALFSEAD